MSVLMLILATLIAGETTLADLMSDLSSRYHEAHGSLSTSHRSLQSAADLSFIVGGTSVTGGYDYTALIQKGGNSTHADSTCTGMLISSSTVLTAGHCCYQNSERPYGYYTPPFVVLLGAYELRGDILIKAQTTPLAQRYATNATVPPKFGNGDSNYDVCLITLNESVAQSTIKPANLVKSGSKVPAINSLVTAVGWGFQQINGELPITNLAGLSKTVSACLASDEITFSSGAPVFICYSAKGGSACIGDSGGPLLSDGVLVGLDSHGKVLNDSDTGCSLLEYNLNIAAPEINDFIAANMS